MVNDGSFAVVAFGSNGSEIIEENRVIIQQAMDLLEVDIGHSTKKSKFYQTPAFPAGSGPDFVNAAVGFQTQKSARNILATILRIEGDLGRKRTTRWAQRKIDLDLVTLGQEIHPNQDTYTYWHDLSLDAQKSETPQELILPHPRLQDRAFVLGPMRDVAPDWIHPVLKQSVVELWDALPEAERNAIQPLQIQA